MGVLDLSSNRTQFLPEFGENAHLLPRLTSDSSTSRELLRPLPSLEFATTPSSSPSDFVELLVEADIPTDLRSSRLRWQWETMALIHAKNYSWTEQDPTFIQQRDLRRKAGDLTRNGASLNLDILPECAISSLLSRLRLMTESSGDGEIEYRQPLSRVLANVFSTMDIEAYL